LFGQSGRAVSCDFKLQEAYVCGCPFI
jgi:hypothetical protein